MPFFKKIPKSKVVAVIDITSSSVGGALVESNEGCPLTILAAPKKSVNFLFNVGFEASLRSTMDSLRFVAKELKNLYPGKIEQVLCVFSSPWFISQTKIITVTREKSFEVKKIFFSRLLEEEEKNFLPWLKQAGQEERKTSSQFIEHEVIKAELNGYHTRKPAGKTARSVKSYIYLSAGAKKAIESTEKEIEEIFGRAQLRFATSPLVAFRVLDAIISNKEGFLIIDIGGETTEINLIRDNVLEQSVSFPRGANLLFRKISSILNTFLKEAPSILKTYVRGHRTMESSDKITSAIKDSVKEWHDSLGDSIAVMAKENLLPQNVFLTGDEPACGYFFSCVEKSDFSEYTILGKHFIAQKINPRWLARYFNPDNSMTQSFESFKKCEVGNFQHKDIMLMMEALYANKFINF